jgi:hypothetical protein
LAAKGRRGGARPGFAPHVVSLIVLIAALVVRLVHFHVPVRTPDETTYFLYATSLYERGPSALPEIVREYRSRPELRDYPSPTRVGHVGLQWASMVLHSSASLDAAAAVSVWSSVGMLLIVWRIAASFLAPWVAPVAMSFLAFSPLDLAMSRRLWGDEPFAFAIGAMLWCFLEHARSRRPAWAVAFFVCGFEALLIKETALFFLVLGTLGLQLKSPPRRAWALAGGGMLTLLAALVFQALACGGFGAVREAWAGAFGSGTPNEYMLKYQTGGLEYYARGFAILQPFAIVAGLLASLAAALAALAAVVRSRASGLGKGWLWPKTLGFLGVMILLFVTVALAYPQKNMRFLAPIYAPLFLMAGATVRYAVTAALARTPVTMRPFVIGAAVTAMVVVSWMSYQTFVFWFIARGVPDLATPWFVK